VGQLRRCRGWHLLYYSPTPAAAAAKEFRIDFHRFADGKTVRIATLDKQPFGIAVLPDHRSLLCALFEPLGSDLMLVENFR